MIPRCGLYFRSPLVFLGAALLAYSASAKPYNVLFINFDDMRPEIGAYGNDEVITPNLDALADDGALFERAYCQQAVCTPSRNSFLSGRRPESSGLTAFTDQVRDKLPNAVTLPQLFKNAGYETVSYGKVFHSRDPISWTQPEFVPAPDPFYPIYLDADNRTAQQAVYDAGGKISLDGEWYNGIYQDFIVKAAPSEAADVDDFQYYDGRTTEAVLDYLDTVGDKPFFLAVGFYKPHLPFSAPKQYWDMYDPDALTLLDVPLPPGTPSLNNSGMGDLKTYIDQSFPDAAERRHLVHGYYACISYVDALLGKIITKLKEDGLYENTIIVAFSDHGYHLGEHSMWTKTTNWELTTRVPLILRLPKMEDRGVRVSQLVELIDVYPTLAQAAGYTFDDTIEGSSLLPLVANPDTPWKDAAFSFFPRSGWNGYSIRTDRYRFNEWRRSGSVQRELYDHEINPNETINYASDPDYADVVAELSAQIDGGGEASLPPLYFKQLPEGFAYSSLAYSSTIEMGGENAVTSIRAKRLPPGFTLTDHGDGTATLSGTAPALKGTYPVFLEAGDVADPVIVHHYIHVGDVADVASLGYWRFEPTAPDADASFHSSSLNPSGVVASSSVSGSGFPVVIPGNGLSNEGYWQAPGNQPAVSANLSESIVDEGFTAEAWVQPESSANGDQTIVAQYDDGDGVAQAVYFEESALESYDDQDIEGTVTVSEDGKSIQFVGNRWKTFPFPIEVTADTVFEFDVDIADAGEIIAIGFETNNTKNDVKRLFQIAGSDAWAYAYQSADGVPQYSGSGVQTIQIPVGTYYTGSVSSLAIACDDDADASIDVTFSNLVIRKTDVDGRVWRLIRDSSGKLAFEAKSGSDSTTRVVSDFFIGTDKPSYVAVSWAPNAEQLTFYHAPQGDGLTSQVVAVSWMADSILKPGEASIGCSLRNSEAIDQWDGGLDELRLSSVALDPAAFLWRSSQDFAAWTDSQGVDGASNDQGDDPDGDGRSNVEEYSFGGDPLSPDTSGITFYRDFENAQCLMSFPWMNHWDSSFMPQTSADLVHWTTASYGEAWVSHIETSPVASNPGAMRVYMGLGLPTDHSTRYFRLLLE